MTAEITRRALDQDERRTADQTAAARRGSPASAADRRRKPERPRVGWIAATAIFLMMLIGAGWELWRLLLLMITMD
jgi:hypothetical protein